MMPTEKTCRSNRDTQIQPATCPSAKIQTPAIQNSEPGNDFSET
jgi:hypothetical protein